MRDKEVLERYLKSIFDTGRTGDATEPSYYQSLVELLEEFAGSVGKKHIQITTLPKKTEAGNPDFRVWDGKGNIVGYIEAKAPTIENLDYIETTDQLKRYRSIFPNLVLTNFFEFRRYRCRCAHEWRPRNDSDRPRVCPKCKSPN